MHILLSTGFEVSSGGAKVSSTVADVSSAGNQVSSAGNHRPSSIPYTGSPSHLTSPSNTDVNSDASTSVVYTSTSLAYPDRDIQTNDPGSYATVGYEQNVDSYFTGRDVSYKSTDVPDTATDESPSQTDVSVLKHTTNVGSQEAVVTHGDVLVSNWRTDVSDSDVMTTDGATTNVTSHVTGDWLVKMTSTSTVVSQMTSDIPPTLSTVFNSDLGKLTCSV